MPLNDDQLESRHFTVVVTLGPWWVELGHSKVVVSWLLYFHVLFRSAPKFSCFCADFDADLAADSPRSSLCREIAGRTNKDNLRILMFFLRSSLASLQVGCAELWVHQGTPSQSCLLIPGKTAFKLPSFRKDYLHLRST